VPVFANRHLQNRVIQAGDQFTLLIENNGPLDLFIHIGDLVKGGRQDRTIGVDFIVPSKSGRLPIPVFCVEQARWHRRGAESGQELRRREPGKRGRPHESIDLAPGLVLG
jgi:hypothetical protein